MKKLVGSFVAGIMIAGTAATTVSAGEYEVQKGDSLWMIANENDTSVDELVELNDLDTTTIHPNELLLINNKEKYTVEQGDTLNGIANNHDVTVSDLKNWNDLSTDLILIGQELFIQNGDVNQDTASESNANESAEAVEETNTSNDSASSADAASDSEGETFTVTATAYTAKCDGCSGITSTGVDLNKNPNAKVIAVDPDVIPLGSEVYVEGYGYATAADVGSAIQGNKIDIHVPTKDEAYNWGVRTVDVTIVE
ncbi:3D domain-containing protein [Virgibacillus sp. YIM 98842]|uniref:LysM peptidoglycan-binding and 3D domain-containing protein n=1 Tax=Virgibacillus sp. YIM 98842 TaxID=2663533 RepID=UPI0013D9EA4A|nr:3D domain-containing protein [Virgibacillus sp. YIM 98842]